MRLGWIVTIACYVLGVASSALAQHPSLEEDRPTDAPASRRTHEADEMDEMDEAQHRIPLRRARMSEMRERFRDATPEQRSEMRAERLRRMESFELRGRGNNALAEMSREEREALRAEVRALPDEERHELRRKLRHFHSLPESEQAELKQRFGALRSLDSSEKEQIEQNTRRWNQMPPHRREELRNTWERFRALPPDLQQEVLEKALVEASANPNEP